VLAAASTSLGIVILLVLVREVFHQLLHPEGRGFLSVALLRGCRWIARRLGRQAMVFAGPASLGLVLLSWFVLAVLGWALVLLPHMPEGFSYVGKVQPREPVVDALYVSTMTVSTLGFGDIVPDTAALRLLVPLESVMGFGLLTASLTWLLSIYQPLARQRTLARQVSRLLEREEVEGRHLQAITGMVSATTIDLNMTSAIYYFHARDDRECFARVSVALWDLASRTANRTDDPARHDARALCQALNELGEVVAEDHVTWARGHGTREILRAWAVDDGPVVDEQSQLEQTHDGRAAAG